MLAHDARHPAGGQRRVAQQQHGGGRGEADTDTGGGRRWPGDTTVHGPRSMLAWAQFDDDLAPPHMLARWSSGGLLLPGTCFFWSIGSPGRHTTKDAPPLRHGAVVPCVAMVQRGQTACVAVSRRWLEQGLVVTKSILGLLATT